MAVAEQLELISGLYRCHNCLRDVAETKRTRRFHLCPTCWDEVMPSFPKTVSKPGRDPAWNARTEEELAQIQAYWKWYTEMEERYPLGWKHYRFRPAESLPELPSYIERTAHELGPGTYFNKVRQNRSMPLEMYTTDSFYPLCECGAERSEYDHYSGPRSLFGKMRAKYCPVCEAKKMVEPIFNMRKAIHPEFDDEDWLDLLQRSHPQAFEVGVLPDYWYELKTSMGS